MREHQRREPGLVTQEASRRLPFEDRTRKGTRHLSRAALPAAAGGGALSDLNYFMLCGDQRWNIPV
jgi:hypothetical protein